MVFKVFEFYARYPIVISLVQELLQSVIHNFIGIWNLELAHYVQLHVWTIPFIFRTSKYYRYVKELK